MTAQEIHQKTKPASLDMAAGCLHVINNRRKALFHERQGPRIID